MRLIKKPSYKIVLLLVRDSGRIQLKVKSAHKKMKSDLSVRSIRIENATIEWIWRMSNLRIFILDEVMTEKSRRVQI